MTSKHQHPPRHFTFPKLKLRETTFTGYTCDEWWQARLWVRECLSHGRGGEETSRLLDMFDHFSERDDLTIHMADEHRHRLRRHVELLDGPIEGRSGGSAELIQVMLRGERPSLNGEQFMELRRRRLRGPDEH